MKSFKMRKPILFFIVAPLLLVIFDQAKAQISLPEMPGPPYPDRWGNNRWGVKYDPRVHGRGRGPQSAPSSSGRFNSGRGRDVPEEQPPTRYRGAGTAPPPPSYPSRNKWIPGLKPLVSSFLNRRRPRRPGPLSSFDHTVDRFQTNRAVDGYVQNYMNHYNSVSQSYPMSSDYVNIQNYVRPSSSLDQNGFHPNNEFARTGQRPMSYMLFKRSDHSVDDTSRTDVSQGSLKNSYLKLLPGTDAPSYRTIVEPRADLHKPAPQITKTSSSVSRNFAKTLSNIYNDYKPSAENSASHLSRVRNYNSGSSSGSSSSSSSSGKVKTRNFDNTRSFLRNDYKSTSSRQPHPPPRPSRQRSRPTRSGERRPTYVEREYVSVNSGGGSSPLPPYRGFSSFRGPPPPYRSNNPSGSISSYDLYDNDNSLSSGGFSRGSPYNTYKYSPAKHGSSGSSNSFDSSSGFDGFSSSGPGHMTVTTSYSMPGPPHSPNIPPPLDAYDDHPSGPFPSPPMSSPPFSSAPHILPHPVLPPPAIYPALNPLLASAPLAPLATMTLSPNYFASPFITPTLVLSTDSNKSTKRKKTRFQHTPLNLLRGLLGRGERDDREKDEDDSYKPSFAMNVPLAVHPPQYNYNPLLNALNAGPPPPPPQYYNPYPPPPPPFSPISAGISSLRDTLAGHPSGPYYAPAPSAPSPSPSGPPPPPPPPPSKVNGNDGKKRKSPDRPFTQHLQDWPRIFTAMGSSVDAVAGGIHAVRKEISKMTGQTLAKGIMVGGSAVHEVSKGMAHVISKMSKI